MASAINLAAKKAIVCVQTNLFCAIKAYINIAQQATLVSKTTSKAAWVCHLVYAPDFDAHLMRCQKNAVILG